MEEDRATYRAVVAIMTPISSAASGTAPTTCRGPSAV
jgi:hypothetical protein